MNENVYNESLEFGAQLVGEGKIYQYRKNTYSYTKEGGGGG